jgi:ketosteroid isomerase-like protein
MKFSLIAMLAFFACVGTANAAPLTTQDQLDIQQLYSTYNAAIDSGDAEGWAATFTPDGQFLSFNGKDALVGFVKRWHESMGGATRRHWNSNLNIKGTADGAAGTVYLMLVDVSGKTIYSTGIYTDTLVKTADGWRFKKRMLKQDAPAAAAAEAKK